MHPPIPHTRTEITAADEAAVLSALRGRVLVEGEQARRLEGWFTEQFAGAGAVATGSCSQALVAALKACGVGPGMTSLCLPMSVRRYWQQLNIPVRAASQWMSPGTG